jgi:AraC-like DNA-binding protein
MINYLDLIRGNPSYYRQIAVDDQLISEYNCPLETAREVIYAVQGYFVYVIEGRKKWHIPGASFDLTPGKCIFVRQGAHIVEQFFDGPFCFVVFFVSDAFIAETLREGEVQVPAGDVPDAAPIEYVAADEAMHGFFHSVAPYFIQQAAPNKRLLELKFRELILNVVRQPENCIVTKYFLSLRTHRPADRLRSVMEENFFYNLPVDEFARMCGMSLSTFKRNFEAAYGDTPGRWLLRRRLDHAHGLLSSSGRTVSETAFDSGFENVSHFSRAYKSRFGISPAQSRRTRG